MKYALGGLTVFVVAPFLLWLGQAITIAALGQVFFLCWALPFLYCVAKSL